jgi:regulator of replication initiation timing
MTSRTAAARSLDLEPVDRLEEKIKLLVAMVGKLRAEQARTAEENMKLRRDLEAAREQLAESESSAAEINALRVERETIRGRVSDMLEQLEALHL